MNIFKLKDLFDGPISGEWEEDEAAGKEIKVLRTTNFTNIGLIDLNKEVVIRKINQKKIEKKKLLPGDIIIEKSGGSPKQPVGRVVFFKEVGDEYLYNNFTAVLRPKSGYNPKYLFYYLFYLYRSGRTLKHQNKTTGIINLRMKGFMEEQVTIPNIDVQNKIVQILDTSFSLIQQRKESIRKLDELVQSVFYEMFGDPVKNEKGFSVHSMSELCTKITDGTHHSPPNVEEGDYKYITAKNIKKDGVDLRDISYVTSDIHKSIYNRCNPEYGDILYIKDGVTTGVATINTLKEEFSLLSSVALLKLDSEKILPHYMKHALNSSTMYNHIRSHMGGAAITRLTLKKINALNVPKPPLSLQAEFERNSVEIDTQKRKAQKHLNMLEGNFNALLQRAFTGELT